MHMFSILRPEIINYMYNYVIIFIELGKKQLFKMMDKKVLPDMKE